MRATLAIALVQSLCFAAQVLLIEQTGKPYDVYLALSEYGVVNGHLWEVVTSVFLHTGYAHFAVNVVVLSFLGRAVAEHHGARVTVGVYLGAALVGNLGQAGLALVSAWLPHDTGGLFAMFVDRFTGPVVASSAGLFGWFGLLCGSAQGHGLARVLRPRLVWLTVGAILVWLAIDDAPRLAHGAHLGALVAGHWRGTRLDR